MLNELARKLSKDTDGTRLLDWVKGIAGAARTLEREVKKQRIDFSTVIEIANQINSKGLDLARIEGFAITMMRGQFGIMRVLIMRQEAFDDPMIKVTAPRSGPTLDMSFPVDGPFAEHLAQIGKPLSREEFQVFAPSFSEYQAFSEKGVEYLIPLVHAGSDTVRELKGVICLGPKIGDRPFLNEEKELAQVLGDIVSVSLQNAQLYHRSIVDGLTQVYSRGHFDVHLLQEVARAKRFLQKEKKNQATDPKLNRFVSLVMVDIDNFKEFNDTYGHPVGDSVLRAVARTMHESVRTMDIVARYGGEEFALVFPETRKDDAVQIAERLRKSVANSKVEVEGKGSLGVTISLGVATFPVDADDIRALVARADAALYKAKSGGRDRVERA